MIMELGSLSVCLSVCLSMSQYFLVSFYNSPSLSLQFKAFGHDMSGTFQSAINELKPLVNRTDGKGEKEEDIADGKGEENDDISMVLQHCLKM